MRKMYLKILIGIIVFLWVIYFIQSFANKREQFTPKINSMYRPYIRTLNQTYENFVNNYGSNIIINKLKKWNVY
jgi:hypothetical protein